jgi:hypothetical protein
MKSVFFFLSLLVSVYSSAQTFVYDTVNQSRNGINRTGLAVLGSWGVANIGAGIIGQSNTVGRQKRFYKTNMIWGGVNLLLAGVGYFRDRGEHRYTISETFKKQSGTEKLFLFNTALDLGYMAFGLYLRERGDRFIGEKRERLAGTGDSFLIQGGFLALFDGIMYIVHAKNGARLYQALPGVSFGPAENGYGLVYRF